MSEKILKGNNSINLQKKYKTTLKQERKELWDVSPSTHHVPHLHQMSANEIVILDSHLIQGNGSQSSLFRRITEQPWDKEPWKPFSQPIRWPLPTPSPTTSTREVSLCPVGESCYWPFAERAVRQIAWNINSVSRIGGGVGEFWGVKNSWIAKSQRASYTMSNILKGLKDVILQL